MYMEPGQSIRIEYIFSNTCLPILLNGASRYGKSVNQAEYCVNFDVYTGKKCSRNRLYGLVYDVIWSLTEPFHHQHQHLYFDCLFFFQKFWQKILPMSVLAKLKQHGDILQRQKENFIATSYNEKKTNFIFVY